MAQQGIILGYWGIRGRGQVTRLVCAHTGVKWEDKVYRSQEEWFNQDKQQLGILFPNLPYIIDGDLKVSQSDILPRYVIKKSGQTQLLGKSARDMALVDNVIYAVYDIWMPIIELFFNKKWEDHKTSVFYKNKNKFAKLEKFINGKDTTMGYLTLADFVLSEFSYYVEKLFPGDYAKFKSLQNIRATVEGLQGVKQYYEGQYAIQAAFLPPNSTVFPFYLDKFNVKMPPPAPFLSEKLSSNEYSPTKQSRRVSQQKQSASVAHVTLDPSIKVKILLISGSLRKASTNTGLLRACVQLNNPNIEFQWATDISLIPLFNQDIEKQRIQNIEALRQQVKNSDGILFGVCQYNQSVSSALKNAYDWLSRGEENSVILEKPAGMVSSGGQTGGLTAQKAFRQITQYCKVKIMERPKVAVKRFDSVFFEEESGDLNNDKVREELRVFLEALAKWVHVNAKKKQKAEIQ